MAAKWWTLLAVCAGTFMLLLGVTIVIVALPGIQRGLHASLTDAQWVIDAYALALAAVLLTSGSLADLLGRRKVFIAGLAAWGATTAVATGLGPVLGGAITSGISWRGIFLVNVPVGMLALAATIAKVAESRAPHARRPDWPGFAVFTARLTVLCARFFLISRPRSN
jgi:MFS family permease